MELKTKVYALEETQDVLITREFDIPLNLLFMAYTNAEIIEKWMGTKVLKLENKKFGTYRFQTTDPFGNKLNFSGVYHDYSIDESIIRTFEFENMGFGVQLEYLTFEKISETKSKLSIHSIYKSKEHREKVLKMPFAYGLNMAHNKLEEIINNLK